MTKKILITGASGFIGSCLVEEALSKGMEVWAGMRKSSSKKFLSDPKINFIVLDTSNHENLALQLQEFKAVHGSWDYIIHCAGVTKCIDADDFMRVNCRYTRHFIEELKNNRMVPERFVFLSSLSVLGPLRESDYSEMQINDDPHPNTAYGRSKVEAEKYLQNFGTTFPFVILRPTGVYGPREKDYFLMAQSIQKHIDFAAGYKRQDLTFVYVKDVAQAAFQALTAQNAIGNCYFLSDGKVYNSRTFSDLIQKELGIPFVVHITSPIWLLRCISFIAEKWAKLRGKASTLNMDKFRIMKQRNWRCNIEPTRRDLGYNPEYQLERGVHETISWYKANHWL